MSLSVTINGNAVDVLKGSIEIENCIEERSTASFSVPDSGGALTFTRGMPVTITRPTLIPPFFDVLFTGYINTPGTAKLAPGAGLIHEITCMDQHYLADKRLIVRAYASQTLLAIVTDIVTDYLSAEGVSIGTVQTGPTITSAIFNYVKASEAFDALAELSGFIWYIDESKNLYFVARATYAAPWNLDNVTYRPIKGSAYLNTGNPLYRNSQYVMGGTGKTAQITENFTGDGVVQSFALGYQVAEAPTVTEDAVPMTVGIKGIDTGKDYYWQKGDLNIYANTPPGGAVAVQVKYYGQYPLIALARDNIQVLARQVVEGGTGLVEEAALEAQHDSSAAIEESATSKLTEYCRDAEKFSYQTHDHGLKPGQLQEITYSEFGFTAHEMLIESVIISALGDTIVYSVNCITGPAMGSWSKFFSGLITRTDKSIRIGESLLLVLLQQIETLPLTEGTDIDSDDFSGGLVNRWIALPPAQGAGYNIEHEQLDMAESTSQTSHATEDYYWDDGCTWDFATWA